MVFFPKTNNTSIILRKTSDQLRLRDILLDIRPVFLKSVKVMENKERLSKTRRDWGDITKCNVVSWIGSWNRKENVNRKTGDIQIKPTVWLIVMY